MAALPYQELENKALFPHTGPKYLMSHSRIQLAQPHPTLDLDSDTFIFPYSLPRTQDVTRFTANTSMCWPCGSSLER